MMRMPTRPRRRPTADGEIRGNFTRRRGARRAAFVFRAPLIRSTMLLDFFATFFSSATALLPIFAQDILHVGARGYGWLYAAPAIGAVVTSAIMVRGVDWIERRGACCWRASPSTGSRRRRSASRRGSG